MAHFLLYFRFSGFRSSFFPLFQPIFFRFSALWVGSRFLFPVFFPAVADIWRVSGRRHSRPLSRPFYAFLFFFTSFRASFRAFSGRAEFSGAPFSGNVPESCPACFPPPLFFVSARPRFPGKGPTFAARLPNARSGAFFRAEARFSRRADCLYRAAANPFLRRFFAVFATFRRRAYFRLCRGILFT